MSVAPCVKNRKTFLFFRWYGRHHYKAVSIWKFMHTSISYHVKYKCELCGVTKEVPFVSAEEIVFSGICSADKLELVSTTAVGVGDG